MDVPLELAFHQIEQSDFIEAKVRERVDRLHKFFNHIVSVRVVVETPHRSPAQNAKHYRVRVDVRVPNHELVAEGSPTQDSKNRDDVYVAVNNAFDKMEKELRRLMGKMQEHHPEMRTAQYPNAVITRINREEGYGFIEAEDGREIYFREEVLEGAEFREVDSGMEVRVTEETGGSAPYPRASKVRIVRGPAA